MDKIKGICKTVYYVVDKLEGLESKEVTNNNFQSALIYNELATLGEKVLIIFADKKQDDMTTNLEAIAVSFYLNVVNLELTRIIMLRRITGINN